MIRKAQKHKGLPRGTLCEKNAIKKSGSSPDQGSEAIHAVDGGDADDKEENLVGHPVASHNSPFAIIMISIHAILHAKTP